MTILLLLIFIAGYTCIAFEHSIKINKAATALLTGILCWTVYIISIVPVENKDQILEELTTHTGDIAGILFFLLGAMTIVELIDAHDGFEIITRRISTNSIVRLLWIISFIAFFVSAILDNLTCTIIMISILRKLIPHKNLRIKFAAIVIIAANAGGAWSPIGDVPTTMLWIGGQISAVAVIVKVFLPSLISLLIPLTIFSFSVKKDFDVIIKESQPVTAEENIKRSVILYSGIFLFLLVPVFKTFTHLPPYMGMMLALGILWVISELIHADKDEADKSILSVVTALKKIDSPSILFFLGILLSVAALQQAGILSNFAVWMDEHIRNTHTIVINIGLLSAVLDNVPLVAAVQGMYPLHQFGADDNFWHFLAYCAGTGGSILIIGSAAGVAAMGMENISFTWYLKKISLWVIAGYAAGAIVFILLNR